MKKLFSLLTLALLTMSAWAANSFVKVTSASDLTNGDYLIVCELTNVAFNGSLAELDVANNNIAVTINDGVIAADATTLASIFTINVEAGTIKSASGKYIGRNADSNGMNQTDVDSTYINTFSFDEDGNAVIKGKTTTLRFNNGTNNGMRFRYYKSGQQNIQLYKLIADEPIVTVNAPTLPAATTFEDSYTVQITNNAEGATLYYSTDGLAWTQGNSVTIYETTTVYAKATLNGVDSRVVSETYTKVEPVTGTNTYVKVTKADQIVAGNKFIVACEKPAFMGAIANYGAAVTKTNGNADITITDGIVNIYDTQIVELTLGGETDAWTFTTSDGKYICWNTGNSLNLSDTISDGAKWIIASTSNGYVLKNVKDNNRVLQYNASNPRFACYTSNQTPSMLFVQDDDPTPVVPQNDEVETLAQANGLNNGDSFTFTGNAVVTYQHGQYMFLRDDSGYGLIYGSVGGTFANGDVLKTGWKANKTTHHGLDEFTGATGVEASGSTDAQLAAVQEVNGLDNQMINAYVQLNNVVSIVGTTAVLANGDSIALYNRFNKEIPEFEGQNCWIKGIVSIYDETMQLYFIETNYEKPVVVNDVNNIPEALALDDNALFAMYNDVVVTFHHRSTGRMWIRDEQNNSGLIYGYGFDENDVTFNNGDVLSDGWTAKKSTHNGVPQFQDPEGISASGDTRDAAPFEVNAIDDTDVNKYVIFKGINVIADDENEKRFYNAADSTVLFNTFSIEMPELDENKTYDVAGVVTLYSGVAQLYITSITEAEEEYIRGDVDQNGVVGIADVTALISLLLNHGETNPACDCNLDNSVGISDVTALVNFLLNHTW